MSSDRGHDAHFPTPAVGERRTRAPSCWILVILLVATGQGGSAQGDFPSGSPRDTVLSNGLTVIAVHNPVIPVATIEMAFRNGAFTQLEPGQEGLPHLMEHMLFKSFDGGDVVSRAGDLDAAYNGTTAEETVTYYLIAPSRNLEKGIELLARAVRGPRFPKDDLLEERERVVNELKRNAADPSYLLDFHTNAVLWGPAFRQKNISGSIPTVLGATGDALEDHYKRYYVPNNAALIVTGDISPDDVFAAAQQRFDSWKRGDDPFEGIPFPPVPPLQHDSIVVVEADAPNVTLTIAWHGPSEADDMEGALAADLFSEIVEQRISGAYHRLVDSGLLHFLSFTYYNSNHVGPIKLVARTVPEKSAAAAAALREEIARMGSDDYFSEDELEMARKSLRVQWAFQRESAISLAHRLASEWSLGGLPRIDLAGSRVVAQSADAVRRYVARYIAGQPRVFVMMVSSNTIDTYNDALVACLNAWERR